jgi:hypothetical protein
LQVWYVVSADEEEQVKRSSRAIFDIFIGCKACVWMRSKSETMHKWMLRGRDAVSELFVNIYCKALQVPQSCQQREFQVESC